MSELIKRVIAGVVLIPVVLFLILWENTLPMAIALYIMIFIGNFELYNIIKAKEEPVSKAISFLGAVFIPLCFYFGGWQQFAYFFVSLIIFIFLIKMFSKEPTEGVIKYLSINIFAAVFFPLFLSFIWLIRSLEFGEYWVIFLFVTIWMSDSFAYFTGMLIGKRRIVPKISPKKSLEGFLGGIVFGSAGALIFYHFVLMQTGLSFIKVFIMAIDVVIAGIVGDLFESMLKRDAGVKDSGNLIPGHGGALDRFDSVTIAAPVLYMYLSAFL